MLYHAMAEPRSGVDIEQMVITLRESVDLPRLKLAWESVVARHPILRTSFQWEGVMGEPRQLVWSRGEVAFTLHDLSGQAREVQDRAFDHWLAEDRRQGFAMDQVPLMRWNLFRLEQQLSRFVWTFHHALLDGRSFPILLEEVFRAYDEPLASEPSAPPPYREFIEWQKKLDAKASETFWRDALKGFTAPTWLPILEPSSDAAQKSQGSAERSLSSMVTRKLATLAKENGIALNTIIQGAWAILLSRYSRTEDVVLEQRVPVVAAYSRVAAVLTGWQMR